MAASANAEAIQSELQKYLSEKDINGIFVKMTEQLLMEKPVNPLQFIVDYLAKEYPDKVSVNAPAGAVAAQSSIADDQADEDSDSDSDSDEDEDEMGDMEDFTPPPPKPRGRRQSVSAAATADNMAAMSKWEKKVHPKSDEEKARIKGILSENFMFKNLDDEQMATIVDAMAPVEKSDGEDIIKQGDQGDNYYILDQGDADVYKNDKKLVTFKASEGSHGFGELAIMYNAPRAATIRAAGACKLWAVDQLTFKKIVVDSTVAKRNKYNELLAKVPILETLEEYERMTVADALKEEKFSSGARILQQGDPGDSFYIIKTGSVSCMQGEKEVLALSEGAYFGEIALLTSKPRQATVVAKEDCVCLSLDRKTFKRVMGPLTTILQRNMDKYNSVMADAI